jgi:sigma-B regulation protein RsbU (phosphoserine phosphatase)
VLVAEDDRNTRRLLQHHLEKWGHEVVVAEDGLAAWERFEQGAFPIVITDWNMPGMDGPALIRRLRSFRRAGYIYVILLTAKSEKEDIVQGMEAGADDFLTKPFDRDELRVRLRAGERIIELEARLRASLDQLAAASAREAQIGGRIQQTLLLGEPPCHIAGFAVAALTIPSAQIDGDFYDFYEHGDRCVDVILGDVMGKGVPAALLGAAVKSQLLRAFLLGSRLHAGDLPEPEEIVKIVHRQVTAQCLGLEFFTTLNYTRFDVEHRRATFVDCGHTRTIHFHARTGACSTLEGDNLPLGVSEREAYTQVSTPFDSGDAFFLYSDGVTEARGASSSELFGEDRLLDVIARNGRLPPEQLIAAVRQAVVTFAGSEVFADDLTCIAVTLANGT